MLKNEYLFFGKDNWNSLNIVEWELALNPTNNSSFAASCKSSGGFHATAQLARRLPERCFYRFFGDGFLRLCNFCHINLLQVTALDPSTSLLRASLRMTRRGKYIIMEGGLSTFSIFCGECRICTYQFLLYISKKLQGNEVQAKL